MPTDAICQYAVRMMDSDAAAQGWYDDGSGRLRWWDGNEWGMYADEYPDEPAAGVSGDGGPPPDTGGSRRWPLVVAVLGMCLVVLLGAGAVLWASGRGGGDVARPSDIGGDQNVTPTGYLGVSLGDNRATVLKTVPDLDDGDISEKGLSTVTVGDAEVVLVDGEVVEIHSANGRFVTPEGVKAGDDISAARRVYAGSSDSAPTVTESSITYVADEKAETGYRFAYRADPLSSLDDPSGEITEVAIVNHVPTFVSTPVMIVLDSSGSMSDEDVHPTRWEAAVGATGALVDAMPAGHQVGLTVYGTQGDFACDDVSVPIPMGALDRDEYKNTLGLFGPSGGTPIAYALEVAASQVPQGEETAIVLVSDGLDVCDIPPCETAEELKRQNSKLAIHTIGFSVDGGAQAELDCIARAGGGVSVLADNELLLTSRLSAMFNSEAAGSSLRPDSYHGVSLGDRADALKGKHGGVFDGVPSTGRVEIVYVDCTVVFEKGVVVEIRSHNGKLRTVDDLRVGDDIARAHRLYAGSYAPAVANGSVTYVADPIQRTGYRFDYAPATGSTAAEPMGRILKIVICRCVEDLLPEDDSIVRVEVFGTHGDEDPDPGSFVNMRTFDQLDAKKTPANERAYEGALLDVTCYVEGFTYSSRYWERSSDRFARVAGSDLYVATLFLVGDDGEPIDDDSDLPVC